MKKMFPFTNVVMHMCQWQHRQLSFKSNNLISKQNALLIPMPGYKNTTYPDGQFSPFVWLESVKRTV